MWKLLASVLCLVAVSGPVTVALAARDDASGARAAAAARAGREVLALEAGRLAARGEATERSRERDEAPENKRVRVSAALEAIAQCESGGDPHAVGGGGAYRGKYQFSPQSWASVGASGDPADAPEAEQDRRAATLYAREGAGHWPACGRR